MSSLPHIFSMQKFWNWFGILNKQCKEKSQFCMDVPLIHFIKDMYDDILMNLYMKNVISQIIG